MTNFTNSNNNMKSIDDIFKEFSGDKQWEEELFSNFIRGERRDDGILEVTFDWDVLINFIRAREEKLKASLQTLLASHESNFLQVGRLIECGHCNPKLFGEGLKQALIMNPDYKCECQCHDASHEVRGEEKVSDCCGASYNVSKSTRKGTRIFFNKCGKQCDSKEPHPSAEPKVRKCSICGNPMMNSLHTFNGLPTHKHCEKSPEPNPECKRCGLLKSTIMATGKLCVSPSTTNIPNHDFGDSPEPQGKFCANDECDGEGIEKVQGGHIHMCECHCHHQEVGKTCLTTDCLRDTCEHCTPAKKQKGFTMKK